MNAAGLVFGAAACLGLGVAAGARMAEAALPRLVRYAAAADREVTRAGREVQRLREEVAELRDGISATWEQGFKAGQRTDSWQLIAAAVQRRERQPANAQWN